MQKTSKKLILLLLLFILLIDAFTFNVEASSVDRSTVLKVECKSSSSSSIKKLVPKMNAVVNSFASVKGTTVVMQFSVLMEIEDSEERTKARDRIVTCVANSGLASADKNRLSTEICNVNIGGQNALDLLSDDTGDEIVEAVSWWSKLNSFLNPVLGFLIYGALVLSVLSFLLDIGYLSIDFVNEVLPKRQSGKPYFVSKEAFLANKECEEDSSSNKIKLLVYLKKRILVVIVFFVLITYVLRGQIYELLSYLSKLLTGGID